MPTEDDIKDDLKTADPPAASGEPVEGEGGDAGSSSPTERGLVTSESPQDQDSGAEEEDDDDGAPAQLGAQRFVYAAYFAGAVAIAFLLSKTISYGWSRLNAWKPQVGEPDEMTCVVSGAVIGALIAFYYYRDEKTRTLAEEVASELGKVTWPTRDEVVNGTFVVLVTTLVATAFFALMDRFWGFVTNLVYGA